MAPSTTTTAKPVPKPAAKQAPKPAEKVPVKEKVRNISRTDETPVPTLADRKHQPAEQGPPKLSDFGDRMDQSTFEQILEMDDDDDKEFSKSIVYGFFEQADNTFKKMEDAL